MAWHNEAAPRLRYAEALGYYPIIPGTSWGTERFRYFATETVAVRWTRAEWCRVHHRKTCPVILTDRGIYGNLHDATFRTWYARTFTSGLRSRDTLAYGVIPRQHIRGIPTDAWAVASTPGTSSASAHVDAFTEGHAPWPSREAPEDSLELEAPRPSYAGHLGDHGEDASPAFFSTVYVCRGQIREPEADDSEAPPSTVLLWAPRSGIVPSLPAPDAPPPSTQDLIRRYHLWGAFITEAHAKAWAYQELHADWVQPTDHPHIQLADQRNLFPVRLDPTFEQRLSQDLLDTLQSTIDATPWHLAPFSDVPDSRWGLYRQSPLNPDPIWYSVNHAPWSISTDQAMSAAMATWCHQHQVLREAQAPRTATPSRSA